MSQTVSIRSLLRQAHHHDGTGSRVGPERRGSELGARGLHEPPSAQAYLTMRFESTTKVLAKRMLKYCRTSWCISVHLL